ncbi:MAG: hypothetical protein AMXMBFR61_14310 [Fimbriimonadales bacterium]
MVSPILAGLLLVAQAAADDPLRHPSETHLRNIRQLTFKGNNAEAYWSFDDKKIIFQSDDSPNGRDQIYIMNPDGSDRRMVSTGTGVTTCGFFFPDGKRILFSSTHWKDENPPPPDKSLGYVWPLYPSMQIFTANADGSDLKQITKFEKYTAEGSVSRHGRVLFCSGTGGDMNIYSCEPDGSDLKQLTNEPGYDGGPFWSPDGTKIVYRRAVATSGPLHEAYLENLAKDVYRPAPLEIWIMDADGSNKRQVTHLGCASFAPYMHPDGKHIIFCTNYPEPRGREFDLYLIGVDGTGLKRITYTKEFDGFPMFSFDGKKLVFCSNRNAKRPGDTNVFVADWVP